MAANGSVNLYGQADGRRDLRGSSLPMLPALAADPWETTVFDLFRDVVWRNPRATALSGADGSLTYGELWNYAAAFRNRLARLGVLPGDRVGLAAGRSVATIAAILGTVMTGACYVPVDVEEFPLRMIEKLAGHAGLGCDSGGSRGFWIADRSARESEAAAVWNGCSVLTLEEVSPSTMRSLADVPAPSIDGNSPFYVMFTSGSTGEPKGVVVPHRAVARLVMGQDFIHFGPEETFYLHSPLSFDASTLELWGSLLHGGRLVLAPNRRLGFSETAQWLDREGVTTLWMTAAMFHLAADRSPEMFRPLRQLLFGGDVIVPRSVERVRTLYPKLRMVNGYGPTENTTFTCCYVVPSDFRREAPLPIGKPIAHTTVHVLDPDGKNIPAGQEGELVAGGAGVALGYLAQPDATAERFPLDTASHHSGARLYRTGDRVRRKPNGEIEFLGRIDRQIKIAGHRVELDAIEAALLESPRVVEGVVLVLTPTRGEKHLAACVSLHSPAEDVEAELRFWLSARLPRASIPRHWLLLEHLPIGATGKLDRTALKTICESRFAGGTSLSRGAEPMGTVREESTDPVGDVSGTTEYLQRLWARLLDRSLVEEQENFFELGGTSLLLIEMHTSLREQLNATLPLADLFDFPTPRALAERLCATADHREEDLHHGGERGQRQRAAIMARRRNLEHRGGPFERISVRGGRKDDQ